MKNCGAWLAIGYCVESMEYVIDWPDGSYVYGIVGAETKEEAKKFVEAKYNGKLERAVVAIYEPDEELGYIKYGQVEEFNC